MPDPTIGQKIAGLIIQSQPAKRFDLIPFQAIPLLLRTTHPSDHNAVTESLTSTHDMSKFENARAKRSDEFLRRRERDRLLVERGKFDRGDWERGINHEAAFFVPTASADVLTDW